MKTASDQSFDTKLKGKKPGCFHDLIEGKDPLIDLHRYRHATFNPENGRQRRKTLTCMNVPGIQFLGNLGIFFAWIFVL